MIFIDCFCYCFCSCRATEWPFWFGLILPFGVIYLFNWAIFVVIMMKLLRRKIETKVIPKGQKQSTKTLKENVIIAIGLGMVFGLGWGVGLAATSTDSKEVTFAFQVVFSVFVGSQGILILLFHGVRSPEFRKMGLKMFAFRKPQVLQVPSAKPSINKEQDIYKNIHSTDSSVTANPLTGPEEYPAGFSLRTLSSAVNDNEMKCFLNPTAIKLHQNNQNNFKINDIA